MGFGWLPISHGGYNDSEMYSSIHVVSAIIYLTISIDDTYTQSHASNTHL